MQSPQGRKIIFSKGAWPRSSDLENLKNNLSPYTNDYHATHGFFIGDGDGEVRLIAGLGKSCDFEAQLNNSTETLEVIDVGLTDEVEVNNTSVW